MKYTLVVLNRYIMLLKDFEGINLNFAAKIVLWLMKKIPINRYFSMFWKEVLYRIQFYGNLRK